MPKVTAKSFKIGLLLSAETEYGRGVLRGVADFAEDHPHCLFRVVEPDRTGIAATARWQPDGLVVMLNEKKLQPRVTAIRRPAVYVCKPVGVEKPTCVQSDDVAVGRLGAEHLMERGASTYGFVGLAEGDYVGVRAEAFRAAVAEQGHVYTIFEPLGKVPGRRGNVALENWLRNAPKPLGLMTCNDICGRYVLEMVRQIGLRVPEDVAVVGVDNEDPLSRLVWPGLSSVSLNTDEIGYKAAAMLYRELSGNAPSKIVVHVAPLGVIARGSTQPLASDDPILSKVVSAINESVGRPLAIDDLAELASISRASLERRFRRLLDRTPLQEIRRCRIERARQLLKATNLPIKAIAAQCGYPAATRLIEAFLAETGITPNAYRAGKEPRRGKRVAAKP
ncbi:MAG: substrate-binding domain-containing protein [Nibricoccus sp.]